MDDPTHLQIVDASGRAHGFRFDSDFVASEPDERTCSVDRHLQLLEQARANGTHFFWGSGELFAEAENSLSVKLWRLMFQ